MGPDLGAMVTAMSVQWTVSRAVAMIDHRASRLRADLQGRISLMSVEFQAFWEAVIGVCCSPCAVLVVTNSQKEVREIYVFAAVLVLESLPFLSAVAIAILENSRVNAFAFWRNTAVRTASDRPAPGGDADCDRHLAAGGLGDPPRSIDCDQVFHTAAREETALTARGGL